MAADKQRQVLTEIEMFSIVESTEEELIAADKELANTSSKILDGIFDAGTFEHLVKAGVYQCSTVMVQEQPAYVMIHTRNALGWLIVEGAVRVGHFPLRHLFEGGDALAKHLKAPKIIFISKLKGLYAYATKRDWKALGVILCKCTPE